MVLCDPWVLCARCTLNAFGPCRVWALCVDYCSSLFFVFSCLLLVHPTISHPEQSSRTSCHRPHCNPGCNPRFLRTSTLGTSQEKPQLPPLHKNRPDEATELLRRAVGIGESWFRNDLAHEKLALWRNKLAVAYTDQVSKMSLTAQPPRL